MRKPAAIAIRRLVAIIPAELKELETLAEEWESRREGDWNDTFFLRGRATIFQDFYSGAERIFITKTEAFHDSSTHSPAWPAILLRNMQLEIP